MPPMNFYPDYSKLKEKILGFYKIFFYGEILNPLEKAVEKLYLEEKLMKFQLYCLKKVFFIKSFIF